MSEKDFYACNSNANITEHPSGSTQDVKLRYGTLKGQIRLADDIDAPLPDKILANFERSSASN